MTLLETLTSSRSALSSLTAVSSSWWETTHRRGHILDWLVDPDDTQLFNPAPPADFNLVSKQTERSVDRVRVWMKSNKLKLNEVKTEAMVVGSRSWTSISGTGHLEIGSSLISFQPTVKDLGVVLDSGLIMCDHISSVHHSAYLELHRTSWISPFLTIGTVAELAHTH